MSAPVVVGIVSYCTYARLKDCPKQPTFAYCGPDDLNYKHYGITLTKAAGAKDGVMYVVVDGAYQGTYDVSAWLETGEWP